MEALAAAETAERSLPGSISYAALWVGLVATTPIARDEPLVAALTGVVTGGAVLARARLARRFHATYPVAPQRWEAAFGSLTLVLSGAWTALVAATLLRYGGSGAPAFFGLLGSLGIAAVAVLVLSPFPTLVRAQLLVGSLPLIAILMMRGGVEANLAWAIGLYVAVLWTQAGMLAIRQRRAIFDSAALAARAAELEAARRKADAASAAKDQFLANISHEVRTPLSGILGVCDLLLQTPLSRDQKDLLGTMQRSGEVLLHTMNEILDFSKVSAGHLELEDRPFDPAAEIEEAVVSFAALARSKGIDLIWSPYPPLPVMSGDAFRLRQVVGNLLGNALKFTRAGWVEVSVREVGSEPPHLELAVEDTGIGIAPEKRERLFRPFSQVDSSHTREFGGTGLGLAICRHILDAMGGTIDFESSETGTRFVVAVPIRAVGEQPSPPKLARATVLLAVTPARRAVALRRRIEALGLEVVESATAASHIEAVVGDAESESARRAAGDVGARFIPVGVSRSAPDVLTVPVRSEPLRRALELAILGRERPVTGVFQLTPTLGSGKGPSVLLVEDSSTNALVVSRMAEAAGARVTVVENGLQAVSALGPDHGYDLVLMDCQMPVLDGYSATRQIRRREAESGQPRVPIVAVTAHALPEERDRVLAAGMDDWLTKPVRPSTLDECLARWAGHLFESMGRAVAVRAVTPSAVSGPATVRPTQPVREPDGDLLDASTVAELKRLEASRPGLLAKVVETFEATSRGELEALRRSVESREREPAVRAAHSLKGSSAAMGALRMSESCRRLETEFRAGGDPGSQASLIDTIAGDFDRAMVAIRRLVP